LIIRRLQFFWRQPLQALLVLFG